MFRGFVDHSETEVLQRIDLHNHVFNLNSLYTSPLSYNFPATKSTEPRDY